MIALLVSPDYASHYLPLSAIGQALRARGAEVVVATGPGLESRVTADGLEHRLLALGPARNDGLMRTEDQAPEEASRLAEFFAATRRGPVATLRYQAEQRMHDLLWQPERVTEQLAALIDELRPDVVLSDQIAYGASLALRALEQPYASLLVGHPSALPTPGEVFGLPPYFPSALDVPPADLARLRSLCARVAEQFAAEFRRCLHAINPRATAPVDPFAEASPCLTLVNYPAELARHRPASPGAIYVGACVRQEQIDPGLRDEIEALPRPRVYASLGSFLSTRTDVLARIAGAFSDERASLVLASGVTDPATLDFGNTRHLVRSYLPQVGVLRHCDLVICHGGNNTVTEALHAGLPLLVGPFASDQFAGAEDVRRAGVGEAFDPNGANEKTIARAVGTVLGGLGAPRAAAIGRTLRGSPGPDLAARLLSTLGQGSRHARGGTVPAGATK
jgi:UDP:flavonoid glycosyltransferase YjiC (YdhE family)